MKKLLFLIISLLITLHSNAKEITLQWLNQQPTSYAKDFYIWRYLDQDISPKEAQKALFGVKRLNDKILSRYIKKSNNPILQEYYTCKKAKTSFLLNKPAYCIEAGLSIYDATKLSKKDLQYVIKKVTKEYPLFAKKLAILDTPLSFLALSKSDPKIFFALFNHVGSAYRVQHFNHHFSKKLLKKLAHHKYQFTQFISLIVLNPNMQKAQKSLFHIDPTFLSYKATFMLAINAIQHKLFKKALYYFKQAYKKGIYQINKDNILFWQYQLTHNATYLKKLTKSNNLNIYTLFAYDKLHKKIPKNMLKKFITPYQKYLKTINKTKQALIYAIAKQESQFNPTAISSAYAMGVMQIMPFLSKSLAKKLHEPYDIDKMLEAQTNLRYANYHLNFLTKHLKHPLLIAYAYNGGLGFTKRVMKQKFFYKQKFEPWLSMELLPFAQTRKYGKKVLANYFIYQYILNPTQKISFKYLIQSLLR